MWILLPLLVLVVLLLRGHSRVRRSEAVFADIVGTYYSAKDAACTLKQIASQIATRYSIDKLRLEITTTKPAIFKSPGDRAAFCQDLRRMGLLFPEPNLDVPDEDVEWLYYLARQALRNVGYFRNHYDDIMPGLSSPRRYRKEFQLVASRVEHYLTVLKPDQLAEAQRLSGELNRGQ